MTTRVRCGSVAALDQCALPEDGVILLLPDPHPDSAARLPGLFRAVVGAIDEADWDCTVSSEGPFLVGDVQREVVQVSAWNRAGGRLRAVFVADAPPGRPRPPFAPLHALVGQGVEAVTTSVADALAFVRGYRDSWHPAPAPGRPCGAQAPDGRSCSAAGRTRRRRRPGPRTGGTTCTR
ncbi:hypothetical protein AB0L34_21940 [Micromonospora sp. NPDC052213]|uniref:hypothetical protein n=1 Tax=Micromonospora sp. NPDC052213 TaxID=3155812 RepID=UPI003417CA19